VGVVDSEVFICELFDFFRFEDIVIDCYCEALFFEDDLSVVGCRLYYFELLGEGEAIECLWELLYLWDGHFANELIFDEFVQ
jgi:hypothetical protein